MATDAAGFIAALGLNQVDVLGFSLGGCVAQALAARQPNLVRRLILAGTAPRGGEPARDPKIPKVAGNPTPVEDDYLFMFFAPSETSQAAGRAFYARRTARADADPPSTMQTLKAQSGAFIGWWRAKDESFTELKAITQPALVVNGMHDAMIPTDNSYALAKNLPDAQLILYPDAGHGAIFQYPEVFVAHAELFLDR
jgi:pimeloyl-ACP methyl ester carboxylesterase